MGACLQLDQANDDPAGRDERVPACGLRGDLHLAADSRALVAPGAVHRVQVRQRLKKGWLRAAKVAAMLLVLALVARSIARNWVAFQSVHVALDVKVGWLAASTLVVFLTYAIQIESWRRMLRGWDQRLSYPNAARAWTLANLGRYIPGKVWSVAGLVVLAEQAGVRRSAAAVSAFAMQAVVLGTGVVLVAIATPHAASPVLPGGAVLAALALIGVLAWRRTAQWLGTLADATTPLPPLPLSAIIASSGLMLISWATFGISFWMLIRGLISTASVPVPARSEERRVGKE